MNELLALANGIMDVVQFMNVTKILKGNNDTSNKTESSYLNISATREGRGLLDSLRGSPSSAASARISRFPQSTNSLLNSPRAPPRFSMNNNQMLISGSKTRNVIKNDVFEHNIYALKYVFLTLWYRNQINSLLLKLNI